jgi:DNA-binding transcriptional MerR regulator
MNVWNKVNLSIDQVSQLTGVKKTTLRYWEKEFSDYLKPDRTETQRRQYSLEEVDKVNTLRQLIEEEKYKSAGVRLKLGLDNSKPKAPPEAQPLAAVAEAATATLAPLVGETG